jgi:colanic acid biosynthesis glycosyl transferase WcaI
MKILLYGINFAPELTGIGKYTGEMAAWLAARGHDVRVVTAPPYYPAWVVSPGYRGNRYCKEQWQGIQVYRCPLWVPHQPHGAKRLLHLASFALSSLLVLFAQLLWRPQLVWVVEPTLFCAPAALGLARLSGAKAWLHVQDFEVDAAFDLGQLRGQRIRNAVASGERWLMRRFDVVSAISQHMRQRLLTKGVDAAKAKMAVNWVDMAQFAHSSREGVAAYRCELTIPNEAVVALYSGNMGRKQGLELLAEVAKLCTGVTFVFCGDGAGRADLLARCKGLVNVRFIDLQSAARLPDLLASADIHLLPQRADAADLVMPSKLTGMFASARPVIVTAHVGTELATIVQNCGLVVPPEDATAFAKAVLTLAANPDLREQFGAAGFAYALAKLDRNAVLEQFEKDATRLCKDSLHD